MPNQRKIAQLLGVTQATVSLALRNSREVSAALREKIQKKAEQLGYRQNDYMNNLMKRVRSGRKLTSIGTIALLVDWPSEAEWYRISECFRLYHPAVKQRALELGFKVETFYLKAPGMDAAKIDRILYSRGIQGVLLVMQYGEEGASKMDMNWGRYVCVVTGMGFLKQDFDRVCADHVQNMIYAIEALKARGYKRIGLIMDPGFAVERSRGAKYAIGYVGYQMSLPANCRIPVFSEGLGSRSAEPLLKWVRRWKPDVILSMVGFDDEAWLRKIGIKVPEDVAVASLDRPSGPRYAGIEELHPEMGKISVEQLIAKIGRNEYGEPAHPIQILTDGHWVDGATVPNLVGDQVLL